MLGIASIFDDINAGYWDEGLEAIIRLRLHAALSRVMHGCREQDQLRPRYPGQGNRHQVKVPERASSGS